MTEEIIIDCAFYKDGVCASPINKTCEYCKNIDVSKCYHKQLKRLEQENKELKEMLSKEPKAMQAFQISYSGLKRDNETLWGMVKDYKSALEEIKNFVINYLPKENYKFAKSFNPEQFELLENILTKINEVLENKENKNV